MEREGGVDHLLETNLILLLFLGNASAVTFLYMEEKECWVDITDVIRAAAKEIRPGQFIAGPSFSFEESMRAIDIMDPKIDTGLGVMEIDPPSYLVKHGTADFGA